MKETLKINTRQGLRYAGVLEDGVFSKRVRRSRHLHRALNAWGFDAGLMDDLGARVTGLVVTDTQSGEVWYVSGDVFRAERTEKDYGYGRQYFLNLKYWDKTGDQESLF